MPDGMAALEQLGVRLDADLGCPFRGIRFVNGNASVEADFPSGRALGIRRTALHGLLAERAAQADVELHWGTPVTGISAGEVRTRTGAMRCRWIVGADGIHSRVRRWAALDACFRDTRRFGFRAHYRVAPWSEYMEIHWGTDCQFYVTPVSAGEVCVVVMSEDREIRLADALAGMPDLQRRLAGATQSSAERGALTSTRRLRAVYRGDVVLIGDASGSVDAITGEGLCLAFRQAIALAGALASGDLEAYAAETRRLRRRPSFMADFMLAFGARPRLRRRAMAALASRSGVFESMLAMHVGAVSPAAFARSTLTLGIRMLRP